MATHECPDCEKHFGGSECPGCGWSLKMKRKRPQFPPEEARPAPPPIPVNTEAEWAGGLQAARTLVKALAGEMSFEEADKRVTAAFDGMPHRVRDRVTGTA